MQPLWGAEKSASGLKKRKRAEMSDYIITYTGKRFYPLRPEIEAIDVCDIARALSLMTRANGHLPHFYSVGQHCVNCVREAKARNYSKRVQLGCLLHDASEAYLSDITRPVKQYLSNYKEFESGLQNKIFERFGLAGLTEAELRLIFLIDDTILQHEFLTLKGMPVFETDLPVYSVSDTSERIFSEVEAEFLSLYQALK